MFLLVLALALTAASIIGKSMAVALVRHYEDIIQRHQKKLVEINAHLKLAQQKHVIAKKAEGLAAHKASTLKYRLSCLEEQISDVELQEVKHELEKNREVTVVLDQVVRKALGQIGGGDEERVQQVMSVITALIDVEKQGNGDDLIAAIREKLIQMKEGPPPPETHTDQTAHAGPAPESASPLAKAEIPLL